MSTLELKMMGVTSVTKLQFGWQIEFWNVVFGKCLAVNTYTKKRLTMLEKLFHKN